MLEARRSYFRAHPLLAGVSEPSLERVSRRSEAVRLRRRAALWTLEAQPDGVWWIRGGVVRVSCPADEHPITVAYHGRGALLGEASALAPGRLTTWAEAHQDCTLYATPAVELERLLDREPSVARRIAALLVERQQRLEARLGLLATRSARRRLARALLDLAGDFGVRDSRGIIVNLRLTHREIGALLGTSRETASLALVELRRAGLVLPDGKRLVLLDPAALEAIAGGEAPALARQARSS